MRLTGMMKGLIVKGQGGSLVNLEAEFKSGSGGAK